VKNSFNSYPLDRLAIAGAVAAFSDSDHFEQTRHTVIASREKLTRDLKALNFEVLPSSANFLLVRHGKRAADYLAQQLRHRNIIVRHFKLPRIENFLRITVGTDPQCQALTTALREILS
jgi:histidinol-phosphate aminotransferase